nr:MAG TPA: hypothetical protein [Caudoviricetes sp.]
MNGIHSQKNVNQDLTNNDTVQAWYLSEDAES